MTYLEMLDWIAYIRRDALPAGGFRFVAVTKDGGEIVVRKKATRPYSHAFACHDLGPYCRYESAADLWRGFSFSTQSRPSRHQHPDCAPLRTFAIVAA